MLGGAWQVLAASVGVGGGDGCWGGWVDGCPGGVLGAREVSIGRWVPWLSRGQRWLPWGWVMGATMGGGGVGCYGGLMGAMGGVTDGGVGARGCDGCWKVCWVLGAVLGAMGG